MKRFKRILYVASEGTSSRGNAAFRQAVTLARANSARLALIDVVDRVPEQVADNLPVLSGAQLQQAINEQRNVELAGLVDAAGKQGVKATSRVLAGEAFLELIREIMKNDHDLLMKTAEGEGGPHARLFSSTDMHLMRKCPCPVWIFKPTRRKRHRRILAAVQLGSSDEGNTSLNQTLMQLAVSLAQMEKAELDIVHAWSIPGETLLRSGRYGSAVSQVNRLVKETGALNERYMAQLLAEHDLKGIRHNTYLHKGDPVDILPALAASRKSDVLVMGTVSRTGIAGLFIGNTAERVLDRVDCSVLTVKPEGFVTPVRLND